MTSFKWDKRFARLVKNEISSWSKDPNEKVGCLLVSPDKNRFSLGFNGFPRKIVDSEMRLLDRDCKNKLSVHAELNAILNSRTDLTGWSLYVTKAPCTPCALAIIQAGIVRVVCPAIRKDSNWAEEQTEARETLKEAGIFYSVLDFDDLEDSTCY